MSIKARLEQMGLSLPQAPRPVAAYVPAVRTGNLLFISGQIPFVEGQLKVRGRCGEDVSLEAAREAARAAALNGLAVAEAAAGLDRVSRVVKLTGYVASAPDFFDQPQVVNGASELLVELFGEAGRHARAAVGVSALPLGAPVEIEMVLELKD
ncbi:MAG: RidA family protein [Thermodesulfobacteriota bacterium]